MNLDLSSCFTDTLELYITLHKVWHKVSSTDLKWTIKSCEFSSSETTKHGVLDRQMILWLNLHSLTRLLKCPDPWTGVITDLVQLQRRYYGKSSIAKKNESRLQMDRITHGFFPSSVLRCVSKDSRRLSGACGRRTSRGGEPTGRRREHTARVRYGLRDFAD